MYVKVGVCWREPHTRAEDETVSKQGDPRGRQKAMRIGFRNSASKRMIAQAKDEITPSVAFHVGAWISVMWGMQAR